jgi:bacterial leucyl aminopeptidase
VTKPPGLGEQQEGKNFFDITDATVAITERRGRRRGSGRAGEQTRAAAAANVTYPAAVGQTDAVHTLLPMLNKTLMQSNLQTFSDFHNRYYKSTYGAQSSAWLGELVNATIAETAAAGLASASFFEHSWGQNSIIVTIPGQSEQTVVLGAHQDSINQLSPKAGRAPGAGKFPIHFSYSAPRISWCEKEREELVK